MDVLTIHIMEDSSDSAVFRVQVQCADPFLLNYWFQKTFFNNGEVQQINTMRINGCRGLVFVLRVLHRSSRLPNSHYWCPFLVTLCLDALAFHYHLPSVPQWNGTLREAMRGNSLELRRWETMRFCCLQILLVSDVRLLKWCTASSTSYHCKGSTSHLWTQQWREHPAEWPPLEKMNNESICFLRS